jgi:hypothetical protein
MSLEDKRSTILNIFHESRDVFVLKVRVARSRIVAPRSLQAGCRPSAARPPAAAGHREAGVQARRGAADHQGRPPGEVSGTRWQ